LLAMSMLERSQAQHLTVLVDLELLESI
jgi:hypothetical protein